MMSIKIQDSFQQIKSAVEDLQAVQTVIVMAEDHPVYSCDHEALVVVRSALESIIEDIREAVATIDGDLKSVQ